MYLHISVEQNSTKSNIKLMLLDSLALGYVHFMKSVD